MHTCMQARAFVNRPFFGDHWCCACAHVFAACTTVSFLHYPIFSARLQPFVVLTDDDTLQLIHCSYSSVSNIFMKNVYGCTYSRVITFFSRLCINRLWLPIVFEVSSEGNMIFPCPRLAPGNSVSCETASFSHPISRQFAHSPHPG